MPSAEKDTSIKKAAARLVRQLPDSASWDDLMYEILVRQKIHDVYGDEFRVVTIVHMTQHITRRRLR